jgi:hypothetical protein
MRDPAVGVDRLLLATLHPHRHLALLGLAPDEQELPFARVEVDVLVMEASDRL